MENDIKLTRKDRAMFIYLFKILKNQGDDDYDYDNMIKALQNGFQNHYSDVFECLYDEELSAEECREVLEILEMYRGITYSYNALKEVGQQGKLTDKDIRFKGFDGNNETKQMSYACYFIIDLDRYEEIENLANGYYNSHYPMLSKYRQMLSMWNGYKDTRYKMNEQQIIDLLNCN